MDTVLAGRLGEIRARIQAAAARSGRESSDVRLMAVTKTHPREMVLAARGAGLRVFGENRVAEAAEKYMDTPADAELHLIGHLQTNKAKQAAALFSWVDSIDCLHTARALNTRLAPLQKDMNILLELNTSGEDSKSGYRTFDDLETDLEEMLLLPRLKLRGLMTVGPLTGDAGQIRAAFRHLRICLDRLRRLTPADCRLDTLSMGMSGDFEIAVEEGANLIRLGTILFGKRESRCAE
ncbi:MAG: YggS family pyridoxal phosphate-dependent enzyme [Spirochaetales bacterium]|jgi:pyridoxal phosphate enzyme (YggS family)|nr:YggS family pyridoxal phosphate-dependent enzyme [Spirochaetales bacterium]